MAFVLASPTTRESNYEISFVQTDPNYEISFVQTDPQEAQLALDRYKVFNKTLDEILNANKNSPRSDTLDTDQATDTEQTDSSTIYTESYSEIFRNKVMEIKCKKYNSKCADCSTKYPSYVVINLSIFICNQCSLHHKALGHDVKSINVDDFTEDEIKILQKNGNNKKSNKTYLAKYKYDNAKNNNQQYIFIKQKYCDKLWTKEQSKRYKKTNDTKKQIINHDDEIDWTPFDDDDWVVFDNTNLNNNNGNNISLQQSETLNIFDPVSEAKQIQEIEQTEPQSDIQNENVKTQTKPNVNNNLNSNSKTKIMNIFKFYNTYNHYGNYTPNYTPNNYYNHTYYQQTPTPPPPPQQPHPMYGNGYHNPFYQRQPISAEVNNLCGWRY